MLLPSSVGELQFHESTGVSRLAVLLISVWCVTLQTSADICIISFLYNRKEKFQLTLDRVDREALAVNKRLSM